MMNAIRSVGEVEAECATDPSVVLQLLREAAKECSPTSCTVRIVGGWVRDKLLSIANEDVDVTVEGIHPKQFAEAVQRRVVTMDTPGSCTTSVIKCNPAQHKFFETAAVHGTLQHDVHFKIEILPLRPTDYTSHNRTTTITVGTPESDALGRDFTINALFYNVTSSKIEDFTGKGIADLRNRVLNTPLAGNQTLMDDPCRCLRAVRFAIKYGLTVSEDLVSAISSDVVLSALNRNVSRERIIGEYDKIMSFGYQQSAKGLELMCTWKLHCVVFSSPPRLPDFWSEQITTECIQWIKRANLEFTNDSRLSHKIVLTVLLMLPLLNWNASDESLLPLSNDLMKAYLGDMKDWWKWSQIEADQICSVLKSIVDLDRIFTNYAESNSVNKVALGFFLKEMQQNWQVALNILCCFKHFKSNVVIDDTKARFIKSLEELGFLGTPKCPPLWEVKPTIRPDQLKNVLQLKSGREVAMALKYQFEFQCQSYPMDVEEKDLLTFLHQRMSSQ